MKAKESLKEGFVIRIGKGEVSLWYDKWLVAGYLCSQVDYINIQDTHLLVKDIFVNGCWNFQQLATNIPDDIRQQIKSVFVNENIEDVVIWSPSATGVYSATTAYSWLSSDPSTINTQGETWSWLWSLNLPENIKFFLWLSLHESLPTNAFCVFRHLSLNANCFRCGTSPEDLFHLLRDCNKAQQVWNHLHWRRDLDFSDNNFAHWLRNNIRRSKGILFSIVCWFIWRSRNEEVFNNKEWTTRFIINQIHSMHEVLLNNHLSLCHHQQQLLVRWVPPPSDTMKLNTDGSSDGNHGPSGFGGLIRDSNGRWFVGFTGSCGHTSSLHAELFGIYNGLQIAWQDGIRKLICESDAKLAIDLILKSDNPFHHYSSLIRKIRVFKNLAWDICFQHVFREGNMSADWLAKEGSSSQQELNILAHCPSNLLVVSLADAMGLSHMRS